VRHWAKQNTAYKLVDDFHDVLLSSFGTLFVAGDGNDVFLRVALLWEVDLDVMVLADLGDDCTSLANDLWVEVWINFKLWESMDISTLFQL